MPTLVPAGSDQGHGKQHEGSKVPPVQPLNRHSCDKPKSTDEFKGCKFTTDAAIPKGSDIGPVHNVCANPDCPIHHPKSQPAAMTAS